MTLLSLQKFLVANSGASLLSIAKNFCLDVTSAQVILLHWVKKGRVHCLPCSSGCGGCDSCPLQQLNDNYYWLD